MITLNTDKGLIRVENWEEIQSRPGFSTEINPANQTLKAIIGRYAFREKIRCGLSNCHTPHAKGYIVVTDKGLETNIGKDCGKTYFGVDFDTLSRQFDRDITEKENRERLYSFSFGIDELREKIASLREKKNGADWVHKKTRSLLIPNQGCPTEVINRLHQMAKARQHVLTMPREATKEEIESIEASSRRRPSRPYFLDEPVANIAGIEALYPENDLRTLLVLQLEEKIKLFENENISSMSYESLRNWCSWVDSIESSITQAKSIIEIGNKLLAIDNLNSFTKILSNQDDLKMFRSFLRNLNN